MTSADLASLLLTTEDLHLTTQANGTARLATPVCAEGRGDLDGAMDSGNGATDGLVCDFCAARIVFDPRLRVYRSF